MLVYSQLWTVGEGITQYMDMKLPNIIPQVPRGPHQKTMSQKRRSCEWCADVSAFERVVPICSYSYFAHILFQTCFSIEIISTKDWFFDTPRKINIEREHDGLEDDFSFCRDAFSGSIVNSPGCTGDKKEPPQDPGFLFPFRRYEFTLKNNIQHHQPERMFEASGCNRSVEMAVAWDDRSSVDFGRFTNGVRTGQHTREVHAEGFWQSYVKVDFSSWAGLVLCRSCTTNFELLT